MSGSAPSTPSAGLTGVHASLANMLESGLDVLTPPETPRSTSVEDSDEPFADTTPRSVFATAKYFRVVAAAGLHVTADDDPASRPAGKLAQGEVVEVLQTRNWSRDDGEAVQPRYRVAKGWVSAFDDAGFATLERMQVAMQEVRSRTWSEQKSRPMPPRGDSVKRSTLSTVDDEPLPSQSDSGSDALPGRSQELASERTASTAVDLDSRGPPMLLGEWDSASAPCYAVPVPPPGGLTAPSPVQVRAFVGLTSRRCGLLHPGEVIQVIETRMVNEATRLRFRGGWVTLFDRPRTNSGGGGSAAAGRQPLLQWTRKPPTKIGSFRDPQLLATLADKIRQERLAAQQRKRQEREELATAVLADGVNSGGQSKPEHEKSRSATAGRPLSGDATARPNITPMVLTGVEPERLGEALQFGNMLTGGGEGSDGQRTPGSARSAAREVLAKLYAGEGGPVDVRGIGAPRTPSSTTTGAPAFRSYTFHVVERASSGRPIAIFTQRYSGAKSIHEEMLGIGIDLKGCEFPVRFWFVFGAFAMIIEAHGLDILLAWHIAYKVGTTLIRSCVFGVPPDCCAVLSGGSSAAR
jgi:hypothetical protein